MQNLLREDVSVRDILTLFECLADHCKIIRNPDLLSEQCRKSMSRTIIQKYLTDRGEIAVVTFDRLIEDIIAGGLVTTENGSSYLNLDSKNAGEILQKLVKGLSQFDKEGTQPILVVGAKIRQAFQKLVCRYVPQLTVLSFDEIPYEIKMKNLEMII